MLKTLERYQKCSYGAVEVSRPGKELENSYREYLKLKGRFESLQRTQRNLLGEDLGPLNTKELEQLERQLDSSLKQVRSTKTQFMLDQLSELQNKEQLLVEANRSLTMKLEDMNARNHYRESWEASGDQAMSYAAHTSHSHPIFHPLDCNPSLQMGYNPIVSDQIGGTSQAQQMNGFIPGWML
ncbi:developmental protein SEPALLATA 1-like isoform X2 [Senna tora]|uniref:Developmental protein SEPALLATA 1-like isoform X2 n=1 Tax=Senna tora TaxID=362788 RepID=A0A834W260_9FABA|nr:developmental protein SEPALLATA 1-like isoform X2 [Senna tora]